MADDLSAFNADLLAFIEHLDDVIKPDNVARGMQPALQCVGLEHVALGWLPPPDLQWPNFLLVHTMSEEWLKAYAEGGHYDVDPIAQRLRGATEPFVWRAIDYEQDPDPKVKEVMGVRRQFGLLHGFAIPILAHDGGGFVSLSGGTQPFDVRAKFAVRLMSLCAFQRVRTLVAESIAPQQGLTEREREVLTWIAAGKSSWEIGGILHITKRTVDAHAKSAVHKLGAVNRAQAVAIALREQAIAV